MSAGFDCIMPVLLGAFNKIIQGIAEFACDGGARSTFCSTPFVSFKAASTSVLEQTISLLSLNGICKEIRFLASFASKTDGANVCECNEESCYSWENKLHG